MHWYRGLGIRMGHALAFSAFLGLVGCGSTPVPPPGSTNTPADNEDMQSDASSKRVYESSGGTSDLEIGSLESGAAALTSFDPGAFVRTSSQDSQSADTIGTAEVDDPPPPPDDGGVPPPDDGTQPPPDDGTQPPPDDGTQPPPDDGTQPPPPDDGTQPPPPDDGTQPPPDDGTQPPPDGEFPPPPDGELLPPPEEFEDYFIPPPDGEFDGSYEIPPPPGGFEGDGGFYAPPDGFDPDGIFFIPPEGFEGDAIFLPPPPEDFDGEGFFFPPGEDGGLDGAGFEAPGDFFEVYADFPPPPIGFEGEWQPPPPSEWDGSAGWQPPPAEDLYVDGAWYPPPPPLGWEGEWFPPPPPPPGVEAFPEEFFFSNDFDEFFTGDFFAGEGFEQGPPPFEQFPFEAFLETHDLHDVIPGVPPEFEHGAFGELLFGEIPAPPPGFPPFPPPIEFLGEDGTDFASFFGDPAGPFPPGTGPDDEFLPPPGLPPEFFEFDASLNDITGFLEGFEFLPPPFPPDEGSLQPALAFVDFDQIAEFLPPDFLPPDEAIERFVAFGLNHPLIGEDGRVNPDLEGAMHDHPPLPDGFDALDFNGDCPQFDDLFTVYDEELVGTTMRGQVNTTLANVLEDGTPIRCSDTTVLETVLGQSTPMVQMGDGVFQTQWVVKIRQLTNSSIEILDPVFSPDGEPFELTRELLSQMIWTMVFREVDTDGDGIPDEIQVSGSNTVEILSETVDGELPPGLPPLPPPPELLLPFDFEGVLDLGDATEPNEDTTGTP